MKGNNDMNTKDGYCKKCILKASNPAVRLNKEGVCNFCNTMLHRKEAGVVNQDSLQEARKQSEEFYAYATTNQDTRQYDCILMLSGGKDSIWLLDKLIHKDHIRPLAFTLNHPYESNQAVENIMKVLEKLGVDHISFTPDLNRYNKYLRYIFTKKKSLSDSERLPCLICSNYIRIAAYLFAYKFDISYIVYCADPFQIPMNTNRQIPDIIKQLRAQYSDEMLVDIFGYDMNLLLNEQEKMPKYVFPYALMPDYNPETMMAELKERDLYDSNPRETHCSLLPLLNYYSIKRHDMLFYTRQFANDVRSGKVPRQEFIEFLEQYKEIMMKIAVKDEITEDEKKHIREVLSYKYKTPGDSKLEHEYKEILNLRKITESLNIKFDEI